MLFTLLIGLAQLSFAGDINYLQRPYLQNGFFVGVHTGAVLGQFRNHSISAADLAGNDTSTLLNNYLDNSVSPYTGISAGFAGSWRRFYFGLVANANYSRQVYAGKAQVNQAPSPVIIHENEVTAKSNGLAFDIAITPGFLISPSTAIYGILGLSRARMIVDNCIYYLYQSGSNLDGGRLHTGTSITRIGKEFGGGIRTTLTNDTSLYFEYTFKNFKEVNLAGSSPIVGAETGDTLVATSHIRPYTQTFVIGMDLNISPSTA